MSARTAGPRVGAPPVLWAETAPPVVRRPAQAASAARGDAAVSDARIGVIVTAPHAGRPSRLRRLLGSRALRTHFGTVAGIVILSVLLWRLGTGVFLDGLRRIDTPTLLAGLAIGALTTVFSAWRWALVARGLRIGLPLGAAVADYYRALFLNAALPGGILGDVHRAVRHGQSEGDVGRGVRAVVLERTAGQLVLAVAGVTILLTLPSPVMQDVRQITPLVLLAGAGACAVVVAVRMSSSAPRRAGRMRAALAEARESLLSRRNGPGVALSSAVVLAGHLAMFVVAARVAGSGASVLALLPIAVLALLAMGLPLNVGGWGPREGVTAWAFGAAGLGASTGLSVAVVYGVLSFVAALPGAVVLVVRWAAGARGRAADPAAPNADERPGEDERRYAEAVSPAAAVPAASPSAEVRGAGVVSSEKYAPKESARLARSSFPFSADPREGRPMTPESV
ncbi:flippase-like domain-containing protein [Streptomyces sp. NBC_00704]